MKTQITPTKGIIYGYPLQNEYNSMFLFKHLQEEIIIIVAKCSPADVVPTLIANSIHEVIFS